MIVQGDCGALHEPDRDFLVWAGAVRDALYARLKRVRDTRRRLAALAVAKRSKMRYGECQGGLGDVVGPERVARTLAAVVLGQVG